MPTSEKRLFVAVSVHQGLSSEIESLIKKIRTGADHRQLDIRWSSIENLHLTLTFLGEKQGQLIPKIVDAIERVGQATAPFELKVDGVSGFADPHSARVIYVGVQRSQKILDLVSLLESTLQLTDSRNYVPHLTLGRLRNPKSIKDLISPFVRKKFGKLKVEELVLFESLQAGPFPIYKPLHRVPLTGTPPPSLE